MQEELRESIEMLIGERTGEAFRLREMGVSHGGCIHQSGVCSDGNRRFFVKLNSADCLEQFEAEEDGLKALGEAKAIRVPGVVGVGASGGQSFMVMEALELSKRAPTDGWAEMGKQLAGMHRHIGDCFGWRRDNFIGSTPQKNTHHHQWAEFFVGERLRPQFDLAAKNGHHIEGVAAYLDRVGELLSDHQPEPSLLHGDLWSGNAAFTAEGDPVTYDPAVYFGDRECDLAFSEFFGGFPPEFYRGYRELLPMDDGYGDRRDHYNLYHVLNHANLFGGGYLGQARAIMGQWGV